MSSRSWLTQSCYACLFQLGVISGNDMDSAPFFFLVWLKSPFGVVYLLDGAAILKVFAGFYFFGGQRMATYLLARRWSGSKGDADGV